MRIIFLDSGPLGLMSNPRANPEADLCRLWAGRMMAGGARVYVPEIVDYEVRRELLHIGSPAPVARLDKVRASLHYDPITTDAMLLAADLWAWLRRTGRPTAEPAALDCDCILAAQALTCAGPEDVLTVATGNVKHLGLMADAERRELIVP